MRYYGVSYYPEQRDKLEFENDLELIINAGFNLVRMGEFSWCKMEPRENEFDFGWLEYAVNRFGEVGIKTILCTPTASLPQWMAKTYPEVLFVDTNDKRRKSGGRKHNCYNSEIYRKFSKRISEKLAEKFMNNPYILGYQVDNELGQEGTSRCCCLNCNKKFIEYLKKRYRSIEELNESFGTIFWGQKYNDFMQISTPQRSIEKGVTDLADMYVDNPSLRLAFENFSSDSLIEFYKIQYESIKKYDNRPVTTNTTGLGTNCIDYSKLAKEVDVFSVDSYPPLYKEETSQQRICNSFSRSVKNQNFWVLEFTSGGGHTLWGGKGCPQVYPGAIKNSVLKTFCDGADVLLHFPFAMFRHGAEQLDGAVLDADNVPRRRYYEIKQTSKELKKIETILDQTQVKKEEIAILLDYNSYWSMKIKPIDKKFDSFTYAEEIFVLLKDAGYQSAIICDIENIMNYKLVVLPCMFVMTDRQQTLLNQYIFNGGNILMHFASAVKNEDNVVYNIPFPAHMKKASGMSVDEYEYVEKINQANVEIKLFGETLQSTSNIWAETLNLDTAKSIAKYTDGYKKGWTVCSQNHYGNGCMFYIGTVLEKKAHMELLKIISSNLDIWKTPTSNNSIEIVCRESDDGRRYWFFFNPLFNEIVVEFDRILTNLNTQKITDKIIIESMGYEIFYEGL